ncbi:MAG: gliding motility-associated C-terminal domain-containing protein [Crocinitomicaceae bacterium]|nr:gliding motility-associated C-terminal domain-containing protein [Crocinitomicaceae bacterium]
MSFTSERMDNYANYYYLSVMQNLKSILCAMLTCFTVLAFAQETDHPPGTYNFLENGGQWPSHVHYRATIPGGHIWLEKYGILYHFNNYYTAHHEGLEKTDKHEQPILEDYIYARFLNSNLDHTTKHDHPTKEYYNFFIGNDKTKWASNIHGYNEIEYQNLYENIDLKFYEQGGQLKYEFTVHPGGNHNEIVVQYFGTEKITKSKSGNIIIESSLGQIIEQKPYVYQIKNGKIIEIDGEFKIEDDKMSFELGEYDQSLDLIIDPVLIFATYSGSPSDNFGMTATYSYSGEAYSGGTVFGNAYPAPFASAFDINANFPWAIDPFFGSAGSLSYGITDVFLSKYSTDGTTMIWTNFLGGGDEFAGTETVHSLICDTANNVYLYGATSSTDFPIMNGFQPTHSGGTAGSNYYYNGVYYGNQGTDIFVSKISSDGTALLGSTYIGGTGNDGINYRIGGGTYNSVASYDSLTSNYGDQFRGEIMLDSNNNVLIASSTRSIDFPVLNSFQSANAGQQDGVLFKISNDFNTLLWSTYFGGSQNDACYSVKIDSSYNILIAGGTSSTNIPGTAGGLNPAYLGGKTDGFVAKITPDGTTLVQSTYIGTNVYDQTIFVEIDRWDNVYIVGNTNGSMPIINAVFSNPNSGQFIMKIQPDLTSVIYSTVFGSGSGDPDISPAAFLVDVCGNVYVSGWGEHLVQFFPPGDSLKNMPVTADAFQQYPQDGFDFYLFVLERDAQSMLYGSYLGDANAHEHVDGGTSRFDKYGVVYQSVCGGCGGSSTFPTTAGAWSNANLSPNCNNIVFKFDFEIVPIADFEISQLEGCAPLTLDLDNESNDTLNSVWSFPPEAIVLSGGANPQILFTDPGTYNIYLSITDTICNLTDTALKVVTVYNALQLSIPDDTIICSSSTFDLVANSYGTASGFIWDDDPDFSSPLASGMDSVITVSPGTETTYYVTATNGWPLCNIIDSVQVFFVEGAVDVMDDTTICIGTNAFLHAENLVPSVNMTFNWSPDSALASESGNTAVADPTVSMYYYVTATTDLGCTYTDSVFVNVINLNSSMLNATATPDTIPEGGTSTLLVTPGGYAYLWFPPTGLSNPTGQTTTATVDQTTTYEVTVFEGTCQAKTTVTIYTREYVCGDVYIFVPNAFSPNADNVNDKLYVRGENILEMEFKIFDRWGELVFETTDQSVGWDGTFKGELVDPDVYVYHLKVICFDQQENLIKGNITLMR